MRIRRLAPPAAEPMTGRQRQVMWAVLLGMVATFFPISILSVSLPDIAQDMDMSTSAVSWVLTAPLLAMAIATPALARLGDQHGHRMVFIAGFAASAVLCFVTALAWSGPSLIALRTLAQLCGAATGPAGMAIILTVVTRDARLRAIAMWSLVGALAPSLGLVVGGPLIDAVGWRAVFVVQGIGSALCVIFSFRILPTTPRQREVSFDVLGSVTLGFGVLALMLGLNQGAVHGWTNPFVMSTLAISPALLALFLRVERRAAHPLLPVQLLAARNVASPLAAQPFIMGPFQGAATVAPFLMQSSFGFGATAITAVALARTMSFAALAGVAGRVTERIGERRSAAIGGVLMVAAMIVLAMSAVAGSLALLVGGMVLIGGAGFARTPFTATLTNAVHESQIGMATAAMNLTTMIGSSIGITAMTAVLSASEGTHAFVVAFGVGAAISMGSIVFALRVEDEAPRQAGLTTPRLATG